MVGDVGLAESAVVGACLVTALFSGLALRRLDGGIRMARRRPRSEARGEAELEAREQQMEREGRLAQWLSIVLVSSLLLAVMTVVLTAEAQNGGERPSSSRHSQEADGPRRSEALGAGGLAAFDGRVTERFEVPKRKRGGRLCLMRYAERGFGASRLSGRWWTSCRTARSLETVVDVKEDLALPARFGAVRDTRVRASIPAGTPIGYYEGRVAPQCEHAEDELPCEGHRYRGGDWQYFFPHPAQVGPWITGAECTRAREDRPSRWAPCPG